MDQTDSANGRLSPKSPYLESKQKFMTHIEAIALRFEDALKAFTSQQNSDNKSTSEIVKSSVSNGSESISVRSESSSGRTERSESNHYQSGVKSSVDLPLQLESEDRSRIDKPPVPPRRERLFSRSVSGEVQKVKQSKLLTSAEKGDHANVRRQSERSANRSENTRFQETKESKQVTSSVKEEKLDVPPERQRLVSRLENIQFQETNEFKQVTSFAKEGKLDVPPDRQRWVSRLVSRLENAQFEEIKESKQLDGKLDIPQDRQRLVSRSDNSQFQKFKESKLLISAAKEGNLDVVKWMIEHGADPNVVDGKGRSALLTAACHDRLGVFKYLLQMSDINMVDENGWNVLHIGAVAGYLRIIEEAINKISIDKRSFSGLTPLCLAVNKGYLHIVEYLLKKGADVSVKSKQGWTPIHFAAKRKHHPILNTLIHSFKNNCDLNIKTSEGETALSLAVKEGCFNCVRLLLDSGADPNPRDDKGWTPARIAAINNYKDISLYLANYGAKI